VDYWGPRYFRVGPFLCARPPPRPSSVGGGSVYAEDAMFVCASRRPQRASDANCRRCNSIAADAMPARSISLPRPATVNGAPLSETKVKAGLAARFSNPQRSQFIRSSRKVTLSHRLPRITAPFIC
jgi:hypothetical protein